MKTVRKLRCRSIEAHSAAEYDELYAKLADEFAEQGITPTEEPDGHLCTHFKWQVSEQIAETPREIYELQGLTYYCKDCPYFELGKNRKCKSKGCTKNVQNAVDFTPACEMFYTMLANGSIKARED